MSKCDSVCAIRRFSVTPDGWTPIVAPIGCSYFSIIGETADLRLLRSSDPGNDSAWYECTGYALVAPYVGIRFASGSVVTYVKAAQAAGTVIGEFIL
jgi:hypothetical protein